MSPFLYSDITFAVFNDWGKQPDVRERFGSLRPVLSGPSDLLFLSVDTTDTVSFGVMGSQNTLLAYYFVYYNILQNHFIDLILAASFSPTEQK